MQKVGLRLPRQDHPLEPRHLYHAHAFEITEEEDLHYVVYEKEYLRSIQNPVYENQQFGIVEMDTGFIGKSRTQLKAQ
jgi:hypothetical protein